MMGGIFSADIQSLVEENRPEREKLIETAEGLHFALAVGARRHIFMFVSRQRPKLPALQSVAMAQMEKGIQVIVRHHVLLAGLAVQRKQNKTNLVPKKPVLHTPEKWHQRRIVQVRVRGALLEVKRKQCEPLLDVFLLVLTPRKAEHLKD